jgi:hypothetical protein
MPLVSALSSGLGKMILMQVSKKPFVQAARRPLG